MTPPSAKLLAKLIGALLSEELLRAEPLKPAGSADSAEEATAELLRLDLETASYLFTAGRTGFGSYTVDPGTVRRVSRGVLGEDESEPADDPGRFVVDAAGSLGLT